MQDQLAESGHISREEEPCRVALASSAAYRQLVLAYYPVSGKSSE